MEVAIIFGMPVLIVGIIKYFNFRTRRVELELAQGKSSEQERKRIAELEGERKLLEERVQNLETIVTSVDHELNGRLNRLAAQQSQLLVRGGTPMPMLALTEGQDAATAATEPPPAAQGIASVDAAAVAARDHASNMALRAPAGLLERGTVLMQRFEVRELIGSGGMGAVYLADDRQLGERVALKTIGANISEDPDAADRFRREVGAARKISHKNVIRIHDLGEDHGLLFLSMEHFEGRTLGSLLTERGALPAREALELLDPICDAIEAAHEAGVVHRDLKPLNILVNWSGDVRVIDFGLAKASYMRTMTATGMIMGTPEYMAPEQVRGEPADQRADVYALALLAFHMVCGRPPFVGDSPIAVGFKQCTEAPPAPRSLAPALPEAFERAVLRGLAKDPAERFPRARDLKRALRGP